MTAIGPFRRLACYRTDLCVVPFGHVQHLATERHNKWIEQGRSRPESVSGLAMAMGDTARDIVQMARSLNNTVVLYYSDDDLIDYHHTQHIRYRLKGGIDTRYHVPALVVEAEGKIHVLKDRGFTLKPLIVAIHNEVPEMIGSHVYGDLCE